MSIQDIIRAWKDRSFRESLTPEQRALLPSNPIGEVLDQDELRLISGGMAPDDTGEAFKTKLSRFFGC